MWVQRRREHAVLALRKAVPALSVDDGRRGDLSRFRLRHILPDPAGAEDAPLAGIGVLVAAPLHADFRRMILRARHVVGDVLLTEVVGLGRCRSRNHHEREADEGHEGRFKGHFEAPVRISW